MGEQVPGVRRWSWGNVSLFRLLFLCSMRFLMGLCPDLAVDHLRFLLQHREELLSRLSNAYASAGSQGVTVTGGHRVWEDLWEDADSGREVNFDREEEWSEDE